MNDFLEVHSKLLYTPQESISNLTNWSHANNQCMEQNDRLPVTTSEEDLKNMVKFMKDKGMKTAWLGMRKRTLPNLHWIDGSSVCEYNLSNIVYNKVLSLYLFFWGGGLSDFWAQQAFPSFF